MEVIKNGYRQEGMVGIKQKWKSYTSFAADY